MPRLPDSLRDWQTDRFVLTLKHEIGNMEAGVLPLDQGTTQGGYVDDSGMTITILHATEDDTSILARAGVFFTEIVASCGCGEEPMPTNAYCEMQIRIEKATAEACFVLLQE